MTIAFPTAKIARAELIATRFQSRVVSPYGGHTQSSDKGATLAFQLAFVPTQGDEALELEAWLESPKEFYMGPPGYTGPSGLGSPLINGAGQAGTAINTNGWTGSTTVLKTGQWVQIGDALHRVAGPAVTNAGGAVTLTLTRPLRTATIDNDPINYTHPRGLFRIAAASRPSSKVPLFTTVSVTVEAVL